MIFNVPAEEFYTKMDEMPSPRVIKVGSKISFINSSNNYYKIQTHYPFELLPPKLLDTCKVIFVCRNVKVDGCEAVTLLMVFTKPLSRMPVCLTSITTDSSRTLISSPPSSSLPISIRTAISSKVNYWYKIVLTDLISDLQEVISRCWGQVGLAETIPTCWCSGMRRSNWTRSSG